VALDFSWEKWEYLGSAQEGVVLGCDDGEQQLSASNNSEYALWNNKVIF